MFKISICLCTYLRYNTGKYASIVGKLECVFHNFDTTLSIDNGAFRI